MYGASGLPGCHGGGCGQLASNFLVGLGPDYPFVYLLGLAGVVVAPAVSGIFWGAPLIARELETGTLGLAWTQSITRARWLAVKLALIGLTAMAVTEGLSLMLGWWAAPIGQAARFTDGSISPFGWGPFSLAFDARGITPASGGSTAAASRDRPAPKTLLRPSSLIIFRRWLAGPGPSWDRPSVSFGYEAAARRVSPACCASAASPVPSSR